MSRIVVAWTLGAWALVSCAAFGAEPEPEPAKVVTNSIGMKLKLISAGEFWMGTEAGEVGARAEEQPRHRVRITKPFYLGAFEVTQQEWQAVMATRPWQYQDVKEGDNYPASAMSWDDAVRFCRKLSAREGKHYGLPTEAQWEYACRAGTTTLHAIPAGASLLDYAWLVYNTSRVEENYPHAVGTRRANPWGLFDMHGNVAEWCADFYHAKYYEQSPAEDPSGPAGGSLRVVRGGCWLSNELESESARRPFKFAASFRSGAIGFRVTLAP